MGLAGRRREPGLSPRRAAGTERAGGRAGREEGEKQQAGAGMLYRRPWGPGPDVEGCGGPLPPSLGALGLGWEGLRRVPSVLHQRLTGKAS